VTTAAQEWEEVRIPARELRTGDGIIIKRNNAGFPTSVVTVSKVLYGEGCKGYHANPKFAKAPPNHPTPSLYTSMLLSCDGCYDGAALVDVVRFSEVAQHV
jgi:hypothetical protein